MGDVKVGIVGLGRLGKRHAQNLVHRVSGARVIAACSIAEEELQWAEHSLGIPSVYKNYHEMLENAKVDAVFLVSSSVVHAQQIITGLDAGLHVFCEKPMGLSVKECLQVEEAEQRNPNAVLLIGFVRRFDASYAYAAQKIKEGCIGDPFLIRSQTVDLDAFAEFQLDFVKKAGGIFMDCNVHDIDIARWLLNAEVEEVHAVGGSFVHPDFDKLGDADNTVTLCRLSGGKIAVLAASRTAFHGHDTHAEVSGSKGILKIGLTPSKNRVEIFDSYGARSECVQDFYERFQDAFLEEAREFISCIRENKPSPVCAHDGTQVTRVAQAMAQSFRTGRIVTV